MDDLRFIVVFYSIASGRWVGDIERLGAMEPCLRLQIYAPKARLELGTAKSAGKRLTTELPGLLTLQGKT